jgi:hypothetical protein
VGVLLCGFQTNGRDEGIKIMDNAVVETIELRSLPVRDFGIGVDRAEKTCCQRGVDSLE